MSKLIVFEGLDNLGKTTQINLLKRVLPQESFVFTSCPGGSETALHVRAILANEKARDTMARETEVLLYAASHSEATHGRIIPALEEGKSVVCDRYVHSALAYQGGLKDVPEETLLILHEKFCNNLQPDIIFYFFGEQYKNTSEDNPGGYDGLPPEKQQKIADTYDKHLGHGGLFEGEVVPVHADGRSEHEIHSEILIHLHDLDIFSFTESGVRTVPVGMPSEDCTSDHDVLVKDIHTVGDLLLGLRTGKKGTSGGSVFVSTKERNTPWKIGEYGTDNDTVYYPNMMDEKIVHVNANGYGSLNYYVQIESKTKIEVERMLACGETV